MIKYSKFNIVVNNEVVSPFQDDNMFSLTQIPETENDETFENFSIEYDKIKEILLEGTSKDFKTIEYYARLIFSNCNLKNNWLYFASRIYTIRFLYALLHLNIVMPQQLEEYSQKGYSLFEQYLNETYDIKIFNNTPEIDFAFVINKESKDLMNTQIYSSGFIKTFVCTVEGLKSISRDYSTLVLREFNIKKPAVVFLTSDGLSDEITDELQFENFLSKSIQKSRDIINFSTILKLKYSKSLDYDASFLIYGFMDDYKSFKDKFKFRDEEISKLLYMKKFNEYKSNINKDPFFVANTSKKVTKFISDNINAIILNFKKILDEGLFDLCIPESFEDFYETNKNIGDKHFLDKFVLSNKNLNSFISEIIILRSMNPFEISIIDKYIDEQLLYNFLLNLSIENISEKSIAKYLESYYKFEK